MRIYLTFCAMLAAVAAIPAVPAQAAPPPTRAKATITASSTYEGEQKHTADLAFDGSLGTSWAEGKASAGKGEWIEIAWDRPQTVTSVSLWAGDFRSVAEWESRNRAGKVRVIWWTKEGEKSKEVDVGDRFGRKDVKVDAGPGVNKVRIALTGIHSGTIFDDTHIAEVAFNFPDVRPDCQAALDAWRADPKKSEPVEKAYAEARDAAIAGARGGRDYDKNLEWLGRALADGAPYLAEKIAEVCPQGYRLQHVPVDEVVLASLKTLRDARGVPYLDAARVRSGGSLSERLADAASEIKAWAQLEKDKNEAVPNWGKRGIAKGALQARDEALGIDVNSQGDILVADIGNNRVQRFTPDGRVDAVWGGADAVIVDKWFGQRVDPYAAGCAPGKNPVEFEQPNDLAVGNFDYVAVIDHDKRVQVIDPEAKVVSTFQVPSEYQVLPGHGTSTPIVTWWGDNFYFLLGNEVWGFTHKGQKVVDFKVEDDILAGVVADGKLLVRTAASRDIVEYAVQDGFRQGRFNKKPIEEDGSEDWDLAVDEDDNVYLLTDTGWLHIWNKKGKALHQSQVSETALTHPRIAVSGSVVYVLSGEKIGRLPNPLKP